MQQQVVPPQNKTQPISVGPGGCWLWRGHIRPDGYGQAGRDTLAHRAAYEAALGQIADGLQLHHVCETKSCVNPAHLVPLTPEQHRRLTAAAISECPHGHAYTPENTRFTRSGGRKCRECERHRAVTLYRADPEKYRARKRLTIPAAQS